MLGARPVGRHRNSGGVITLGEDALGALGDGGEDGSLGFRCGSDWHMVTMRLILQSKNTGCRIYDFVAVHSCTLVNHLVFVSLMLALCNAYLG